MLVPLQVIPVTRNPDPVAAPKTACDWLSFRHVYRESVTRFESGRTLRIDADGSVEWESQNWQQVRCPSSDTSIRVRCDGRMLQASGNIGRFQQSDNVKGLSVIDCVDRWAEVLGTIGFDLAGFGTRWALGTVAESGTYLTRIDLAGNFQTDSYSALCHALSVRRIGQRLPQAGRYGPMWGYDSKRGNWCKAKLYDKTAEQAGKRRSDGGATLARFEVQLGGEWLKQNGLDTVKSWGDDMAEIVYGRFAEQVFRDQVGVEDWAEIPTRLRAYAVLWRDGVDVRTVLKQSQFYAVAKKLRDYGIDIATPCNVVALVKRVREVQVHQVCARRAA